MGIDLEMNLEETLKLEHECDGEGCGMCFEDGCSYIACLCDEHRQIHEDGDLPGFLVMLDEIC